MCDSVTRFQQICNNQNKTQNNKKKITKAINTRRRTLNTRLINHTISWRTHIHCFDDNNNNKKTNPLTNIKMVYDAKSGNLTTPATQQCPIRDQQRAPNMGIDEQEATRSAYSDLCDVFEHAPTR